MTMSANATTFGPVENFDVINDTGKTAHGFHIRLHGLHSSEITSLFGAANRWPTMERYGVPTVTDAPDMSYVDVTYQATFDPTKNAWPIGTQSGTLAVAPTDSCWPLGDKNYNTTTYPCDHFGVSTSVVATSVDYEWLLETSPSSSTLVSSVSNIPSTSWAVPAAVVAQPAAPQIPVPAIKIAPVPQAWEFGEPKWYDSGNPNGSGKVDLTGVAPDPGAKSIVYRFEIYSYKGRFDPQTHEALDLDPNVSKGDYQGAQNAAVNLDGVVPAAVIPVAPAINNSLPDAVAGVTYKQIISVTPGHAGDTVNVTVTGLPHGLSFNPANNTVSGMATQIGTFNVLVTATDVSNGASPVTATTPMKVTDPAIVFTATLPNATAGAMYNYSLAASGGDAPFTYALTSGKLPAGLTLSTTGLISGKPTAVGIVTLSFTATDSVGVLSPIASSNLSVVTPAAACSGTNSVISFANKFWLDISGGLAQGGISVYYAPKANTTFAPGLTFGAFAAGQLVTYSGQMDAANQFCLANTMSVSLPLRLTAPAFTSVQINTAFGPYIIAPKGGWSPYTIAVTGTLPKGVTFNGTTISGTPTVSGTFPVAISVTDAQKNKYNITTLSIVVNPAPVIAGIAGSCTIPAGAKTYAGVQGAVTAVSGTTVTIGKTVVTVPACASITWKGNWTGLTKAIRNGYNVQVSKGYVLNGVTTATTLIIDNGL